MATYYVYSGATGAGTGADWANAYTTLTSAFVSKAAGDVFYVADDHAESTAAAITLTTPGTQASPCQVLCVNRAGSVPPVSADLRTTATVSTTGASNITLGAQTAIWYGIALQAGSSSNLGRITINISSATGGGLLFSNCKFSLTNTNTASYFACNGSIGAFVFENCVWKFNSVSQSLQAAGTHDWKIIGGSVDAAGTIPNFLITQGPTRLYATGFDLSALGSGKTLANVDTVTGRYVFQNCKLGSSVAISAALTNRYQEVLLIASDSSGVNYRYEKHTGAGVETTETTVVRTGGASNGTTAQARKIVTNSRTGWAYPFESEPLALWQDTTGSSKTITIYGIWGGASVPNNDDIWIEVRHMGSSATPVATITSNTKADILATGSALDSDSSSWGGSTTAFKMSVSVTPEMKGPLYVVVKAAKASSTFYYDPLISVT